MRAVEGEATRRPIDAIIANLNEIHQSLTLLATNPQKAAQANASLQTQVATLRNNAVAHAAARSRTCCARAAGRIRGRSRQLDARAIAAGAARSGHAGLASRPFRTAIRSRAAASRKFRSPISPGCSARMACSTSSSTSISRRTPIRRSATGPGGRTVAVARTLSPETLREFQRAAHIRDAFFQTGGNMPMVTLAVKPPVRNAGNAIKLDIGGTVVEQARLDPQPPSAFGRAHGPDRTAITLRRRRRNGLDHRRRTGHFGQQRSSRTSRRCSSGPGPGRCSACSRRAALTGKAETSVATFIVGRARAAITRSRRIDPQSRSICRHCGSFAVPSGI